MRISTKAAAAAICLAAGLCGVAVPSLAQKPDPKTVAAKPALSAAQALDKSVDAQGGKAALASLKSLQVKGSVALPAQNLKGTFESFQKDPNKLLVIQNIEGIGETRQGYDGKVGWSKDPIMGLRTLGEKELVSVKQQADLNAAADWRKQYPTVTMLGYRDVNGTKTYAIQMTPKTGNPQVQYLDTTTFLPVRIDLKVESPQGTVPVETYPTDYRSVNGVKVPFTSRQRIGGAVEILIKITNIEANKPISDSLFSKPKPGE